MNIQEFLDKLNIKEVLNNITQQLGLGEKPSEEETNSYYEMAYGLYFSRGLKDGDREWAISKERIINYVEFHLNKPCNRMVLSAVLRCFDFNGHYYYFPTNEAKLSKLKKFENSSNYKYSRGQAYSIANTKLKDLQFVAEFFNNETAKEYYIVSCAILSSIKEGVTFEGIKNYISSKLGACDSNLLSKVLENFAQGKTSTYSSSNVVLYRLAKNANILYLNKNVFSNNLQEMVNGYTCSVEEGYHICYPEITEKIDSEYKKIIDIVEANGVKYFKEGVDKVVSTYKSVIGEKNIQEYIHTITRNWYFKSNQIVEKVLVAYLEVALWKQQEMHAVASVALRTLRFKNFSGDVESYQTFSEEECRKFVMSNDVYVSDIDKHPYEKEEYTEKYIKYIKGVSVFDRGDRKLFDSVDYWMPDFKTDSYYTDAVCYSFLKAITVNFEDGIPDDLNELCDAIWKCIELSDEERQAREEKERESQRRYEEYCAEREEKSRQEAEAAKQKAAEDKERVTTESRQRQEQEKQAQAEKIRKQQEEAQRREEANKIITYYCFGPLDYNGVNVISHVNNVYAAKKAMLNTYGKSESDIKFWSGQERKDCSNYFDGRNFH